MNADANDGAFDALLTDSMHDIAAASHPAGPAPDEAWRRIDRRRHRNAVGPRVVWPMTVAAALLALVVVGGSLARGGDTAVELQPGASTTGTEAPVSTVDPVVPVPGSAPAEPPATAPASTTAPGVSTPGPTTVPASGPEQGVGLRGVRSLDFTALVVPTAMCASGTYVDASVRSVSLGSAFTFRVPFPADGGNPTGFSTQPVTPKYRTAYFGDVTGDAVEDAVVVVNCVFGMNVNQYWGRAVVVDGSTARPSTGPVLATSGAPLEEDDVPSANGNGTVETVGRARLFESMVDLHIENGNVVASWVQTANPVIPRVNQWSRRVESRHRVKGAFLAASTVQIQPWVKDPYGSVLPFGPTSWG